MASTALYYASLSGQEDPLSRLSTLRADIQLIINACAEIAIHPELCTLFIERCDLVQIKLKSLLHGAGKQGQKLSDIADSPGVWVGFVNATRTLAEIKEKFINLKTDRCSLLRRIEATELIRGLLLESGKNLHDIIMHPNLQDFFQDTLFDWARREEEALELDTKHIRLCLGKILRLMQERRTDIRGVMTTLLPSSLEHLLTPSKVEQFKVEGVMASQELISSVDFSWPKDHPCYKIYEAVLSLAMRLIQNGEAAPDGYNLPLELVQALPSPDKTLQVRMRHVGFSCGHLLDDEIALKHYHSYSNLIHELICRRPQKHRQNTSFLQDIIHVYIPGLDIKDPSHPPQPRSFQRRDKPYIADVISRLRVKEGTCSPAPLILAFIHSGPSTKVQGTTIEYIPSDSDTNKYTCSSWKVIRHKFMAADPPHFLHIIEESSTTNTNGNDQNAGKQNHTLFLSRYLPPRPHLELEEKEVVTQTAFGERRTVHFIDRNPPARLAIPGKLQPVELPPVLTAQDVSLKLMPFLTEVSVTADYLESLAVRMNIATQQSLELAAQARLLVSSLNLWIRKEGKTSCQDFLAAKHLRRDLEAVENFFSEVIETKKHRDILSPESWEHLQSRIDSLRGRLFLKRYYWTPMSVEDKYFQQVHERTKAFDSWDVVAQRYYFQDTDKNTIFQRMKNKVGMYKDTLASRREGSETERYSYRFD